MIQLYKKLKKSKGNKINILDTQISSLKEIRQDIEEIKELRQIFEAELDKQFDEIKREISLRIIQRQLDYCIGLCQEIENYND